MRPFAGICPLFFHFHNSTVGGQWKLREFSMPLASVRYHAADSCGFKPCQGDDKPKEQQGATFFLSFSFQNLLIQDLDLVAWFSYFVWHRVLSVTFITSVRLHPQEMTQFNTIQTRSSTSRIMPRPHERASTGFLLDGVSPRGTIRALSWSAPRTSQPVDAHHELAATLNSTRRPL